MCKRIEISEVLSTLGINEIGLLETCIDASSPSLIEYSIKELLIPNYNPNYTYWIGGDSIAINPVNKETITINSAAGYDWVTAQVKNDKIQIMTSGNFETDGFTKTSIILKYVKIVIE